MIQLVRHTALAAMMMGLMWDQQGWAATCTVASSGVDFGAYDPIAPADTRSAGSIKLVCDEPVSATVAVDGGVGGSSTSRVMSNGRSLLHYQLYTDPQRTSPWGDGTGGTGTLTLQGDSVERPIYGTVPSRQAVTVGSYGDTIVLTVSY